jgi:hypothetical protein
VAVNGFKITTGAETLLAAARDLGILDLVILGDSALRTGDCTIEELEATAAQQRRGAPRLRAVLPLLDDRSESPWESVMRVLHQAVSINVEPQKEIFDQWGRFVARATSGWSVLDEFTNTTETDIVSVRLTAATWLEIADLSRSTANEWVSPQPSYFTKAPKSSPARTAYWEEAGIRDALRGGRRR